MKKSCLFMASVVMSILSFQLLSTPKLIDSQTYRATTSFKSQLNAIDLSFGQPVEAQDGDFPSDHLKNLAATLRCFFWQDNYKCYLEGESGRFNMTEEQAGNYLDMIYAQRVEVMPESLSDKEIDIIIPCGGVKETAYKRVLTLSAFLQKKNPAVGKVHFLVINDSMPQIIKDELHREEYKGRMSELECLFHVVKKEVNKEPAPYTIAMKQAKQNGLIAKDYAIIVGPVFAEGLIAECEVALGDDHTCHGPVCVPIKDWKKDMELYGYTAKRFGSKGEAAKKWVLSDLNFKAHTLAILEQKRLADESKSA